MKKIYFLTFILTVFSANVFAQAFSTGSLVVYKVGDGVNPITNAAFPVNLDEYNAAGVLLRSHPLPTAVSGSNRRIIASGTATSEGLITLSPDGQFLVVTGYDTFPDPTRASLPSAPVASVNRVVGIINNAGTIDATTALTDAFSTSNIRGAVTTNGTDIWVSGTGTPSSTAGVRYTTKGSTTSTELSTTPTNIRSVNIYNGQLYCSSASGAFQGISSIGTGLPTTGGQTTTILPGFSTTAGPSPYMFSINPAGTVAYVGDANSHTAGGGVQKWTQSAGTWSLAYTLDSGITSGVNYLTVDWSHANPTIYAVTGQSTRNRIISITDAGDSTAQFNIIATADSLYIFRGIAFSPGTVVPVKLTSFNATLISNSAVSVKWATAQELGTKQFEVEKSTDGVHFTTISTTAGAGNSSIIHNYEAVDPNPTDGINYYRIKQVDLNGQISYSTIVKINYSAKAISVFPNPASSHITLKHPVSTNALILITDLQGRRISTMNVKAGAVSNTINVSELAKGGYFIRYIDANNSQVATFTKQ